MSPRTKARKGEQLGEALEGELGAYEKLGLFQRSVGQRTVYRYRGILLRYQKALNGVPPSLEASRAFLAHLREQGFSPSSLRLTRAALQGFHSWRGEQLIFPVRVPHHAPTYIEPEFVDRLMDLVRQSPRDHLILRLMTDAGLRREEVVDLCVKNVGRDAIRFRGKGGKDRTVPLTSELAKALGHFCEGKEPNERVLGVSESAVYRAVKKYGKLAGRPELSPHDLRHSFAERLTEKGASLRVVQELMGHESIATTQVYIGVTANHLKGAIQLLEDTPRAEKKTHDQLAEELKDVEPDTGTADPELGPHRREIFYFGQRLRDCLNLATPLEMAEALANGNGLAMWSGRPDWLTAKPPRDAEEENVEQEWGFDRYDARTHPLFPAFQQHLAGHPCWVAMGQLGTAFSGYREACQQAYTTVFEEINERLGDLAEREAKAMAESLLMDAYYRVTTPSGGLEFSYEPEKTQEKDQARWHLQLGAWSVGHAEEPAALQPLALVHKELVAVLPLRAELKTLGEASRTARQAIEELRRSLSPDARLRKLVLDGHCDLCPRPLANAPASAC